MSFLLRALHGLRRRFFHRAPVASPAPGDPRLADPWLAEVFATLGERYRLGPDSPDGARLLRRTARAVFHPFPVWLRASDRLVAADYEVRAHGPEPAAQARKLLDARVTAPLAALGLAPAGERSEEWAGTVFTRRYAGVCGQAPQAAAAVRFFCVDSELLLDTAAE